MSPGARVTALSTRGWVRQTSNAAPAAATFCGLATWRRGRQGVINHQPECYMTYSIVDTAPGSTCAQLAEIEELFRPRSLAQHYTRS